jgi:hypothetical protein
MAPDTPVTVTDLPVGGKRESGAIPELTPQL